jgi:magnesium-transporting ATPase (P-type)
LVFIFVFIEKMGSKELAVSNVIRGRVYFSDGTHFSILSFYGYYHRSDIWIKRICLFEAHIGENNYSVCGIYVSIFCVVLLSTIWLMQIFTNDEELLIQGEPVMKVISFALLYFSISMPLLSAVSGMGDTQKHC